MARQRSSLARRRSQVKNSVLDAPKAGKSRIGPNAYQEIWEDQDAVGRKNAVTLYADNTIG